MENILTSIAIGFPLLVAVIIWQFRESGIVRYITPRFLSGEVYTRPQILQAGIAWLVWALWLITAGMALINTLANKDTNDSSGVIEIIVFVMSIVAFATLIAGLFYLLKGVFTRGRNIRLDSASMLASDPRELDRYVAKLRFYTRFNILTAIFTVALPLLENWAGVEPTGPVVLVNVAFIIAFIVTYWRTRFYVVTVSKALEQSGLSMIASALLGTLAFFLVWYHSFRLQSKYEELAARQEPPTRPHMTRESVPDR